MSGKPDYLTRFDGREQEECPWHQKLQVCEAVGASAENEDRNPPPVEILLVWDLLVGGDQEIEISSLSGGKQNTILQTGQLRVSSGLAIVIRKQKTQLLVDALIKQDSHRKVRARLGPSEVLCIPPGPGWQAPG